VAALQGGGKAVFLVSGGFRQVIHPIAQQLGIPLDHVYANQLLFKVGGWVVGVWGSQVVQGNSVVLCRAGWVAWTSMVVVKWQRTGR
jgi:hypothetical protein